MRVHLVRTFHKELPYAIMKLCAHGNYGYLIYGDSRGNCIKKAHAQGHHVFDDEKQTEEQSCPSQNNILKTGT
jgi:hypothetical protein